MEKSAKAILFNEGELIGYKALATEWRPSPNDKLQYFCINPLLTYKDLQKNNLSACRNILLEFDKASLKQQEKLVQSAKLPYSIKTFSGNKSYHYIISLEESLSEKDYTELVELIYAIFPTADQACSNSNRLSRTPGAFRDNDKLQELIEVRQRISLNNLMSWIRTEHEVTYLNYQADLKWRKIEREKLKQLAAKLHEDGAENTEEMLMDQCYPSWRRLLTSESVCEGDRHTKAVGLGTAMRRCGFDSAVIEEHLSHFLLLNGKSSAHTEARKIVVWLETRVLPDLSDAV